jgi:hypothetical protein
LDDITHKAARQADVTFAAETSGATARAFVASMDDGRVFSAAIKGAFDWWKEW